LRIAVVSDIHANLTALEAVIADLRLASPDLVVQGGDLIAGGTRPAEVIDCVRALGWPGVYGNADEMLWRPDRLDETLGAPQFDTMRRMLQTHTIPENLATIGDERLAWLRSLPVRWDAEAIAVVHAGTDNVWQSPGVSASDEELAAAYAVLGAGTVVFGHIHHAFVRRLPTMTVANAGSVSLPFDGDARAAYLLVDGDRIEIRRVAYDVEAEIALLQKSRDPFASSTIQTLRTARYAPGS